MKRCPPDTTRWLIAAPNRPAFDGWYPSEELAEAGLQKWKQCLPGEELEVIAVPKQDTVYIMDAVHLPTVYHRELRERQARDHCTSGVIAKLMAA